MKAILRNLAVSAALALMVPAAQAAVEWTIRDLGTLGGDNSAATGINELGQVVGWAQTTPTIIWTGELVGFAHAFITAPDGGTMTDLGQLGETGSSATGVNDAGRVVGTSALFGDTPAGFVTGPKGAGLMPLGGSEATAGFKRPADINNLGQVAGADDASVHPFVTGPEATGFIAIGAGEPGPLPYGDPVGINDRGQVAMSAGYLWTAADGARSLGADVFEATGINEGGQIVGRTVANVGFITAADGGALSLLGTLGGAFSAPTGLNDLGQVIGLSETTGGLQHAFVSAAQGGALTDLELLPEVVAAGWSGLLAAAINDAGQIAGSGFIGGHQRAFLLTPPVPEPETWALMLGGLALLGWRARRAA